MAEQVANGANLRPAEIEAVYAISRVVAETVEIDKALAQIVKLARPVFIFDNAVLYLYQEETDSLEPAFARAIGRGRSSEADLAWGEMAAQKAFKSGGDYIHQPEIDPDQDRLEQRFYLALPLLVGGQILGALVFIRFGGPEYEEDQLHLARTIVVYVAQVLEHQRLVERIANLEAERRLSQLQSDFIATVSHELRTPLGFIKGYSTTLLREDTEWDEETRREFLKVIDEESDRLGELVDNLLDSSRLQAGTLYMEMQHIDLAELIHRNLGRLRNRYNNLQIGFRAHPEQIYLQADTKRLEQLLENLLSNASKYASGSHVNISLSQDQRGVHLIVEDDGPGIPAEHVAHVFKRFYRVPHQSEGVRGSGLGLYICDQIARAHKGTIQVQSESGQGSRFVISIPVNEIPPLVQEG